MSNREKLFWGAGVVLLILLFLASSTDLIIKEKEVPVYPISVILSDDSDSYYDNLKRGLDKAVEDFHADISTITLYEKNSQSEQTRLVQREIQAGARALVLEPVNTAQALVELERLQPGCPVVLLGAQESAGWVADSITIDWTEAGEKLGQKVAEQVPSQTLVCLFTRGLAYTGNAEIYQGIRSVLEQEGYRLRLYQSWDENAYRQALEEAVYMEGEDIALIAMDPQALEETVSLLEKTAVYQAHVQGVYGFGATSSILTAMETGIVDGIITWNQFDQGYLSIRSAVNAIEGRWNSRQTLLDTFYLEAEDLHRPEYEKMLYPIE